MNRGVAVLCASLLWAAGCAQGGGESSGSGRGGDGGGFDAGPSDASAPRPDAPITGRPDSSAPRPDAGADCAGGCTLPNATSSCVEGRCVIDACAGGFDDCDGDVANGCEQSLSSPDHCGACRNACSFDGATAECVGGACRLGPCDAGRGDCNGMEADGCEETLGTDAHCSACSDACGAGSTCEGGSCTTMSCPPGSSSCDGDTATGCETDHTSHARFCASAENFGSAGGDLSCGFLCGGTSFSPWVTRRGTTGDWFRARVVECSSCPADVYHCFTLEVPAGIDYDLVAYDACGSVLGSLPEGPGTTEEFCVYRTDGFSGDDDSFDYWLEVVHRSGSSCFEWRLTVETTSCSC